MLGRCVNKAGVDDLPPLRFETMLMMKRALYFVENQVLNLRLYQLLMKTQIVYRYRTRPEPHSRGKTGNSCDRHLLIGQAEQMLVHP